MIGLPGKWVGSLTHMNPLAKQGNADHADITRRFTSFGRGIGKRCIAETKGRNRRGTGPKTVDHEILPRLQKITVVAVVSRTPTNDIQPIDTGHHFVASL